MFKKIFSRLFGWGRIKRTRNHYLNHKLEMIFQELRRLRELEETEFQWFKSQEFVTKNDLKETERKIMSTIAEFVATQNAFNDRMDVAITGLQGDVAHLNVLIAELQASVGQVTPEDQA